MGEKFATPSIPKVVVGDAAGSMCVALLDVMAITVHENIGNILAVRLTRRQSD